MAKITYEEKDAVGQFNASEAKRLKVLKEIKDVVNANADAAADGGSKNLVIRVATGGLAEVVSNNTDIVIQSLIASSWLVVLQEQELSGLLDIGAGLVSINAYGYPSSSNDFIHVTISQSADKSRIVFSPKNEADVGTDGPFMIVITQL